MQLSELKTLHVTELVEKAAAHQIENASRMRKQDLIFALLKNQAKKGESIFGDGTLEVLPDGFGFLRSPDTSYLASTDDIYVSPSQIRRFNLHTGDSIEGEIRTPKDGERYFALVKVDKVNEEPPEASKHKIMFENLTPYHPTEVLKLERDINGLVHLSELAHHKVTDPAEVLTIGQRIDVQVINIEPDERRIGLSIKALLPIDKKMLEQLKKEREEEEALRQSSGQDPARAAKETKESEESAGKFIASKTWKKYYPEDSAAAKKIKAENRIEFSSEDEARKAGYAA